MFAEAGQGMGEKRAAVPPPNTWWHCILGGDPQPGFLHPGRTWSPTKQSRVNTHTHTYTDTHTPLPDTPDYIDNTKNIGP